MYQKKIPTVRKIKLPNKDVDNQIKAKGKITSKLHMSTIADSEYYNFRLSCKVGKNYIMDFTIKCNNKDLVENLAYDDTVVVEGYLTDSIYRNKNKKTIKILRTIYCDNIKKIVDNK